MRLRFCVGASMKRGRPHMFQHRLKPVAHRTRYRIWSPAAPSLSRRGRRLAWHSGDHTPGRTSPQGFLARHWVHTSCMFWVAYTMKKHNRATVVGAVTRGGANGTNGARLDKHFIAAIPVLSPIHPRTKTNWEGSGVRPDIVVDSGKALAVATKEILTKLAKKT